MRIEPGTHTAKHDMVARIHLWSFEGCIPQFPECGGILVRIVEHVAVRWIRDRRDQLNDSRTDCWTCSRTMDKRSKRSTQRRDRDSQSRIRQETVQRSKWYQWWNDSLFRECPWPDSRELRLVRSPERHEVKQESRSVLTVDRLHTNYSTNEKIPDGILLPTVDRTKDTRQYHFSSRGRWTCSRRSRDHVEKQRKRSDEDRSSKLEAVVPSLRNDNPVWPDRCDCIRTERIRCTREPVRNNLAAVRRLDSVDRVARRSSAKQYPSSDLPDNFPTWMELYPVWIHPAVEYQWSNEGNSDRIWLNRSYTKPHRPWEQHRRAILCVHLVVDWNRSLRTEWTGEHAFSYQSVGMDIRLFTWPHWILCWIWLMIRLLEEKWPLTVVSLCTTGHSISSGSNRWGEPKIVKYRKPWTVKLEQRLIDIDILVETTYRGSYTSPRRSPRKMYMSVCVALRRLSM